MKIWNKKYSFSNLSVFYAVQLKYKLHCVKPTILSL